MTPDLKRVAAEVSVQHGIRIDPDDPILAVVTINRMMLETAVTDAEQRMRRIVAEFNGSVERLEVRAGAAAAKEVRACAAAIRNELSADVSSAGLRGKAALRRAEGPHPRVVRTLRAVAGVFLALGLFLSGFLAGHFTR